MRKIMILFVLAVVAFLTAVPVYAADNIGGTWRLTMISPRGQADSFEMVITQDDKNLNVTVINSELQMELSGTGTLKGEKIKFSLKAANHPEFEWDFKGKVTGKKMEGKREIQKGRFETITFLPPGRKPTPDEIKNLSLDAWSAVMK